jgi:hypothetical protein
VDAAVVVIESAGGTGRTGDSDEGDNESQSDEARQNGASGRELVRVVNGFLPWIPPGRLPIRAA